MVRARFLVGDRIAPVIDPLPALDASRAAIGVPPAAMKLDATDATGPVPDSRSALISPTTARTVDSAALARRGPNQSVIPGGPPDE